MSVRKALTRDNSAVLIVDMQEGNIAKVERGGEVAHNAAMALQAFAFMGVALHCCELEATRLGTTTKAVLHDDESTTGRLWRHTAFDCLTNDGLKTALSQGITDSVILVGFEAHVSILQTARGLLSYGFRVVVLNDLISSVTIYDYSTAIAELRDMGVRISSSSTILHEMAKGCQDPLFGAMAHVPCCSLPW